MAINRFSLFIIVASVALPLIALGSSPGYTEDVPLVAENLQARPPHGGTQTNVQLTGTGLPAGATITILAGQTPDTLQQVSTATSDENGGVQAGVRIPEAAERNKPYYFATEVDGRRVGLASFNVIVAKDVAPAGAGGFIQLPKSP